ncbi:ABC transporter ATP-binding protein [Desnuesiella massiliensis]|uniref:ABC transporter ATP-binding protein n=1 Tax=Desnuesiella massiliensis TaxID=1650662 RepID=UPI0006E125B4|nr:oligopeptide/dipeptide ABC transporter ATP-binding protein [Desnuesiella massiliensis]
MHKNILEVQDLKKYFPLSGKQVKAVDGVSFSLEEGTTLGIVGESGSGKSTIARLILKLIEPTSGKVDFLGESLYDLPQKELRTLRSNMQMIFQNPYLSLFPHLSIGDNIEQPFIINRLGNDSVRREKVLELMDLVGVSKDYYHAFPHELSGGQQQRVGIARALALNPKLIICDEPVSSLDVSIQAQILNLLEKLQKDRNLSYIFIAHNLAVVEHISKKVAVMYLGKFVECADTAELYNNPLHPYTKALLEAVPSLEADGGKAFEAIYGEIPSPLNPPKGCRFCTRCKYAKPECLSVEPEYREVNPGHFVACHLV